MTSPLVQKLSGVRDLKRILETTVRELGETFNADSCQVMLSNPLDPNVTSICEFKAPSDGYEDESVRFTLPLVLQGTTFGSVSVSRDSELSSDEVNTLRVLLGELGDIIRLAQINDIVQRDTFRETFLVEIGNVMAYSLGIGDALFMVVNILGKALGASRCLFICTDDNQAGWKCYEFWQQEKLKSCQEYYWPSTDSALVAQVLLSRTPLTLFEGQENSYVSPVQEELQLIGVKSFLGVALRSQNSTHGCVLLQQCDYRRAWTRNEVDMIQNVADKVAEALLKLPAEKLAREPIMQLHQRVITAAAPTEELSDVQLRRALKGALGHQAIPSASKTAVPGMPGAPAPAPVPASAPAPMPAAPSASSPPASPTTPPVTPPVPPPVPPQATAPAQSTPAEPVAPLPQESADYSPSATPDLTPVEAAKPDADISPLTAWSPEPVIPESPMPGGDISETPAPVIKPVTRAAGPRPTVSSLFEDPTDDDEPSNVETQSPIAAPEQTGASRSLSSILGGQPSIGPDVETRASVLDFEPAGAAPQVPDLNAESITAPSIDVEISGAVSEDPYADLDFGDVVLDEPTSAPVASGAVEQSSNAVQEQAVSPVESVAAPADSPTSPASPDSAGAGWGDLDSIPTPSAPAVSSGGWGDLDSIPTPKNESASAGSGLGGGLRGSMLGKAKAASAPSPLFSRGKASQNAEQTAGSSNSDPVVQMEAPPSPVDEAEAKKKLDQLLASGSNETSDYIFATPGLDMRMLGRIDSWVSQIEEKDKYINGHARQVALYSVAISQVLGMSESDVNTVRLAALVHDLGKLGISKQVLQKPEEELEDDQFVLKMGHSVAGAQLLESFPELQHLSPIVMSHHEEYDGEGFPQGLKSDEIPIVARILCVANSYHELIAAKTAGEQLSPIEAQQQLVEGAGRQFDPTLVEALIQAIMSGKVPSSC